MSDYSLTPYREDLRAAWNGVVLSSKNGNFLHLRDYMDYHAYRFDERSVIVERRGKPVAVLPCNQIENAIISHGGLTYAGLIYGDSLRAPEVLEIFQLIAAHYRTMDCDKLIYKAIPRIFHRYPADEDLYALFRLDSRLFRRDLSSAIPMAHRLKLSDLRKRTIRKAEKQGVIIREGECFDAFHALLSKVLLKFGARPVHSPEEMQWLKGRFTSKIRLFGAYKDDILLAGTLVYDFGHVAHTQYLASSEHGREIGALDYVLAYLLNTVFADRQYFSFGISTDENGRHLNEGLIFQKEGFGGRGVVHDFYEWVL